MKFEHVSLSGLKPNPLRDWMIENYGDVCSLRLHSTEFGIEEHPNHYCAAPLRDDDWDKAEVSIRYPEIGKYNSLEVMTEYYDFLFDKKESPYRSLFSKMKIKKHKRRGEYFYFTMRKTDHKMPSEFYMNFAIATRIPWEFPHKAHAYALFREHGFSKLEAFYLSLFFNYDGKNFMVCRGDNSNHFISTWTSEDAPSFTMLRDSKPDLKGGYISKIWNKVGNKTMLDYVTIHKGYAGRFKKFYFKDDKGPKKSPAEVCEEINRIEEWRKC